MAFSAKRSRGFTITLNNYSEDEYNNILHIAQLHTEKWIFGKEVGESGTPHIQGYIYFKNGKTMQAIIKLFKNQRIHFERALGNGEQNYNYCSKDGDYICKGFDIEPKEEITIGLHPLPPIKKIIVDRGIPEPVRYIEYDDVDNEAAYWIISLPCEV